MPRIGCVGIIASLLFSAAYTDKAGATDLLSLMTEERQVWEPELSPVWMQAVGRLVMPGRRCSLIMVREPGDIETRVVISQFHCLADMFENPADKNSTALIGWKELQAHLNSKDGKVYRNLSVFRTGGNRLGGDWAIMILDKPVPVSEVYSFTLPQSPPPYQMDQEMAVGNSATATLPNAHRGNELSYDESCRFDALLKATGGDVVRVVECQMNDGASGGAYVGFYDDSKEPVLLGILKAISTEKPETGYYVHLGNLLNDIHQAISHTKNKSSTSQ